MSLTDFDRELLRVAAESRSPTALKRAFSGEGVDIRSTPFGDLRTTQTQRLVELKSVYPISNLRDVVTVAGSATVTDTLDEYQLDTTANGADRVVLESAEKGRYVPGSASELGIAVRTVSEPEGDQVFRWGYFDDDDGYFFGKDSTGLFVGRRKSSTDTLIYQDSWNIDKLDGTGPSGLKIDTDDGFVYQIDFVWYGYGSIEWSVLHTNTENKKDYIVPVHRQRFAGATSTENPNLPISAEIDNNGTAVAKRLFVAGRKFELLGSDYSASFRITPERRLALGVTTTPKPVISFRRGTTIPEAVAAVNAVDIITDSDIIYSIHLNASLTGPAWGVPTGVSATETSLQSDVTASAFSGGELIGSGLISGSRGDATLSSVSLPIVHLIRQQPITLAVRTIASTGNISAIFKMREEW